MTFRWDESKPWHRLMVFGLTGVLFVLGMQLWVWEPLEQSMAILTQDNAQLTKKAQDAIKSIALMREVESEVAVLREKLLPTTQGAKVDVKPQTVRRKIVDIAKQTGVSIRLWKPQKNMIDQEETHMSMDIVVKIEGSFFSTVRFMEELLQIPWIQTVNPLVLTRKKDTDNDSLVKTDFTIHSVEQLRLTEIKERLKT